MANFHNLPMQPTIDWANVISSVVVVHNEEKKISVDGGINMLVLTPHGVMDSNVLMLGKIAIDGLRLTNVNFNPCPYRILASMGGLGKIQRLTKHEIVIQINPNKPIDNIIIQAQ